MPTFKSNSLKNNEQAKKKLIAVHLLNDWSGSPLIMRQALEIFVPYYNINLYTSKSITGGFLDNINGVKNKSLAYGWHKNKFATFAIFFSSQINIFFKLIFCLKKSDTVYINTLLPFGAALAAKIKGCRTIYHIHEVSIKPRFFQNFLSTIANKAASEFVFVSEYVSEFYMFPKAKKHVVYNTLPKNFNDAAAYSSSLITSSPFTALMICSLKEYKGIYEFIALAKKLHHIHFMLVLNASQSDTDNFIKGNFIPHNCKIYAAQKDTAAFYNKAHIVLNLSRTTQWIETFGMTVLEAMRFGRPVIVPPVGGVCELVDDGVEGFRIDSEDSRALCNALESLSSNIRLYIPMSEAAKKKAAQFSHEKFAEKIKQVLENKN